MDINQIFEGLELSEETVAKIATIYEAAVLQGVNEQKEAITAAIVAEHEASGAAHIASLNEQFEAKGKALVEEYEAKVAELETQTEAYLTESVKKWISENRTEVVNMQRLQVMEDFTAKMRSVFAECQIDLPESEHSLAEDQAKQIAALSESQAVLTSRLQSLTEEAFAAKREVEVMKLSEGLTMVQAEKLKTLAEGIETKSIGEFAEKLNTLKEAFLKPEPVQTQEPAPKNITENLNEGADDKNKPAKKVNIHELAKQAWRHGLQ